MSKSPTISVIGILGFLPDPTVLAAVCLPMRFCCAMLVHLDLNKDILSSNSCERSNSVSVVQWNSDLYTYHHQTYAITVPSVGVTASMSLIMSSMGVVGSLLTPSVFGGGGLAELSPFLCCIELLRADLSRERLSSNSSERCSSNGTRQWCLEIT